MSLPKYRDCYDSGIDWLGKVPRHWKLCKFRHVFTESAEKIEKEVIGVMLSVSGYRGIEVKEYDDENRRRLDEDLVGYRIVRPGQLVVNTMWLNYAGLGVSDYEGHVSPAYRSYWIAPEFNKRYVHHLMRCESFVKGYTKFLTGIRPNSLQMSRDDLMVFQLLRPPIEEQVFIAAFLDLEISKIDSLIAEQEKLITLLAEKRQATILHAVTKGLDPQVQMKDSEVAWLGEVPAHWTTMQLRYFADVLRGKFTHRPRNDPAFYDGDYPFIQTGDITGADRYIRAFKQTLNERGAAVSKEFPAGTLVMAIAANIGDVAILDFPAYFPDSIVGMVPKNGIELSYLYYLLIAMKAPMLQTATISTQMNLNVDQIASLVAACPPADEQKEIADWLDGELCKLEALKTTADLGVALLKERRNALIATAVTGKIDVRSMVENNIQDTEIIA